MKLLDVKKAIAEYQYLEDTNIIDFALACVIANRLKLSSPVWAIIIGASSGGKSQILNPLTLTDPEFIHRIDDLTENTFLSGAKSKEGSSSLLLRIGSEGMITVSDMTVLMSKSSESRATILSQFRMLFDGEMVKHSGNQKEPIVWKGRLGVLAGSTPSIYRAFEEVADMGERFIYYRMHEFDPDKATHLALERKLFGRELDEKLGEIYGEYIKSVVKGHEGGEIILPSPVKDRIVEVAGFSERVRTPVRKDWKGEVINEVPISAYPMRVSLQLTAIAKALSIMQYHETGSYELNENNLKIIDWVGYSLANEEKRACLKILATNEFDYGLPSQVVADEIGLDTTVVKNFLQNLTAVKILKRAGASNNLHFSFINKRYYDIVRRIEGIEDTQNIEDRELTDDEEAELDEMANETFSSL